MMQVEAIFENETNLSLNCCGKILLNYVKFELLASVFSVQ